MLLGLLTLFSQRLAHDFTEKAQVPTSIIALETNSTEDKPSVLGIFFIPTPTLYVPIPTIPTFTTPKSSYRIAIIGDSMVDTMGERMEYLEAALKARYPRTQFELYNYGRGSERVADGLKRIDNHFANNDRRFDPLSSIHPDIIIVGSFAYNPYFPPNRDQHHQDLLTLNERMKQITPEVYQLIEIAPMRNGFGMGPQGVNWDPTTAYTHTGFILEQIESAKQVAHETNTPLIDVFTPSVTKDDGSGRSDLVSTADHIHPSVAGHQFMAEIIAKKIVFR
ncbi:MAG: GDSL-like Lipase/Acylhydrolase [Microgenomates bacterium OLB22]|nr:MAG: GDSL-like Lipase/Acylhydrolase [Microgenomates bacterium OLB22]